LDAGDFGLARMASAGWLYYFRQQGSQTDDSLRVKNDDGMAERVARAVVTGSFARRPRRSTTVCWRPPSDYGERGGVPYNPFI